jgi:hypothetical protein
VRPRLVVLPLLVLLACLGAAAQASATSPSGVVISKLRLRTAASQFNEYVEIRNTTPALTQNLVAPGVTLKNLWSEAPSDNRYSFQFDGQLQTLDHVFVSDGLHAGVQDVRYVHFDNDYFERDETHTAAGVSDHDPPLVTIAVPRRR